MLVEINHGKLIVKKMILHVKNGYGLSRNGQMLQMVAIWVGKTMIDHEWVFALSYFQKTLIEGSLEVKLPTIWTDEKQSREEAERRGRLEERRVEEKE